MISRVLLLAPSFTKESGHVEKNIDPKEPCNGGNPLSTSTPPGGGGVWPTFPIQYPFAPFPAPPFWGLVPSSPWVAGTSNPQPPSGSVWTLDQPGSSCTQGQDVEAGDNEEDDVIELLNESEALEFVQFDPSV